MTLEGLIRKGKTIAGKVLVGLGAGACSLVPFNYAEADMKISIVPEKRTVAVGGEIGLKIRADSRDDDVGKIRSSDFDILVPEGMKFERAEYASGQVVENIGPNEELENPPQHPDDFFRGLEMIFYDFGDMGGTGLAEYFEANYFENLDLIRNNRHTRSDVGVENREGLLGIIYLEVEEGVKLGEIEFGFDYIKFTDTDGNYYARSANNLQIEEGSVNVIHSWADVNRNGVVDKEDLMLVRNNLKKDVSLPEYENYDVNKDGVIDLRDLVYVRNRLESEGE